MHHLFSSLKALLPGLLLTAVLAAIAVALGGLTDYVSSAMVALALGMVLGNLPLKLEPAAPGFKFVEKKVLETAIVLLGFGLNAAIFSKMGITTWAMVGVSVLLVLLAAYGISRWLGLSGTMGVLLGTGSAICGSAAIMAVSPLLKSRQEETGLAVGVINLLSTIGLLLLPVFVGALSLGEQQQGLMIGGTLQSMGHVVCAGFLLGEAPGGAALVVKMGRVLLLIPLILIFFFANTKKAAGKAKAAFPWFVPLFIVSLVLAQLPFFPASLAEQLATGGNYLLIAAMVAIGFKIKFRSLFKMAGPVLIAGSIVFSFQIIFFLAYILISGA